MQFPRGLDRPLPWRPRRVHVFLAGLGLGVLVTLFVGRPPVA
jgi:hypothetical protein